ncbi:hypothetical protein [Desulfobulbus oligotrophicus]|uniref:Uncharacterized protein n=1 Tax=Desulfobulbus oligotrophicus TaxID=1909699 RepID=A0A7T5VCZ1_9BACT|nr:hypothetical protein [Desulfobulbus oligotrophicus]QQG65620.1 hypothetical protein HP555_06930 [Desulfobulbus oligotrophicus]
MLLEDLEKKRRRILQAMDYSVPEKNRDAAEDLLDIYREDRIALAVLHEFYSYLPEAREDWIKEIRLLNRHHGIFLLAACTSQNRYLYLVSNEGLEFQGCMADGFLSNELLDFFGYESAGAFSAICAAPESLMIYEPLQTDTDICPACHSVSGECHELGCPVELCPWCGGQLIHCDCRYEQLGLDTISTEEELLDFERLLEQRGRIPYSPEQRPSFAEDGPYIMFDE